MPLAFTCLCLSLSGTRPQSPTKKELHQLSINGALKGKRVARLGGSLTASDDPADVALPMWELLLASSLRLSGIVQ